eukprot:gene10695-12390_t
MLIGILSLALPISVNGSNFQVVWDQVLKGARVDDQCAQQMCPDMACVMNALDDHSFAMETLNEIMAGEIKNVDALTFKLHEKVQLYHDLTFELHEKVQLYHDSFDRVYAHLNIPASTSSRLMDAIRSYVEESLTARVTGTPFPPPVLHIPLDAGNSVIHRRSMGTLDPKGGVEVVEARGESVATIPREPAMADEGELASSHASIAEEMKMLKPFLSGQPHQREWQRPGQWDFYLEAVEHGFGGPTQHWALLPLCGRGPLQQSLHRTTNSIQGSSFGASFTPQITAHSGLLPPKPTTTSGFGAPPTSFSDQAVPLPSPTTSGFGAPSISFSNPNAKLPNSITSPFISTSIASASAPHTTYDPHTALCIPTAATCTSKTPCTSTPIHAIASGTNIAHSGGY